MKIEKISDTQVKFILEINDLEERDINMTELAYNSEKMQKLFRELMLQAMEECDFVPDNEFPLMIEAIPLSFESVMIIITKVTVPDEINAKLNIVSQIKSNKKYQSKKGMLQSNGYDFDNLSGSMIFCFSSIDEMTSALSRVKDVQVPSRLYKLNAKFYLKLLDTKSKKRISLLETSLIEFGQRIDMSIIEESKLIEYGEVIIKENALSILKNI